MSSQIVHNNQNASSSDKYSSRVAAIIFCAEVRSVLVMDYGAYHRLAVPNLRCSATISKQNIANQVRSFSVSFVEWMRRQTARDILLPVRKYKSRYNCPRRKKINSSPVDVGYNAIIRTRSIWSMTSFSSFRCCIKSSGYTPGLASSEWSEPDNICHKWPVIIDRVN